MASSLNYGVCLQLFNLDIPCLPHYAASYSYWFFLYRTLQGLLKLSFGWFGTKLHLQWPA